MPAVNLSPILNGWQGFTPSGLPLSLGLVQTYIAGTSTPLPTYTTNAGNIANANPTQLLADGRPPQEIWLDAAYSYKFVLLDSLMNIIGTYDNIQGIDNTVPAALSEWVVSGLTPAFVNATTFTVAGNQTALFEVGRRVRYTLGGGQFTGSVVSSVFGAVTTVVVRTDSIPLDGTLSAVDYGFLDALKPSVPTTWTSPITVPGMTSTALGTFSTGINVGNSAQASTTTFDWYEEGGFTPGVTFGGLAVGVTYNANRGGNFTRRGDRVSFALDMRLTSKGSSVGSASITGLPYASASSGVTLSAFNVYALNMTGLTGSLVGTSGTASTNIGLGQWGATGVAAITDANFTNTSDVYITGEYRV